MTRRRWPWLLLALVLLPVAYHAYLVRPRPGFQEQAAALPAKRAEDPAAAADEAAVRYVVQEPTPASTAS